MTPWPCSGMTDSKVRLNPLAAGRTSQRHTPRCRGARRVMAGSCFRLRSGSKARTLPARESGKVAVTDYSFGRLRVGMQQLHPLRLEERSRLSSQEVTKFFDCQFRVPYDTAHGDGIDRIVPGNGENANAIRHHGMLSLPDNTKTRSFQRPDGPTMTDPGHLRHRYTATSTSRTSASGVSRDSSSTTARYS